MTIRSIVFNLNALSRKTCILYIDMLNKLKHKQTFKNFNKMLLDEKSWTNSLEVGDMVLSSYF